MEGDPDSFLLESEQQIHEDLINDDSEHGGLPWERRHMLGFFPAVFATIRGILIYSFSSFKQMSLSGSRGDALFFLVLISVPFYLIQQVYAVLAVISVSVFIGLIGDGSISDMMLAQFVDVPVYKLIMVPVLSFFVATLSTAAIAYISSGMTHIILFLRPGHLLEYSATFRAYCYAYGAAAVMGIVPIVGGLGHTIWGTIAFVIALMVVHGIRAERAVVAAIIPLLVSWILSNVFGVIFRISLDSLI